MSRKIEAGCYAIVRGRGEPVQVLRRIAFPGYRAWETSDGEYTASELRRVSLVEYENRLDAIELQCFMDGEFDV